MKYSYFLIGILLPFLVNCSGVAFQTEEKSSSQNSIGEEFPGDDAYGNIYQSSLCPNAVGVPLLAGQHYDSGRVFVGVLGDKLVVDIKARPGVLIRETHVDIAKTPEALASSPGSFDYKSFHNPMVIAYTYQIPLSDLGISAGDLIYVKVHLAVESVPGQEGRVISGGETAWAQGTRADNGVGWSMYFANSSPICL